MKNCSSCKKPDLVGLAISAFVVGMFMSLMICLNSCSVTRNVPPIENVTNEITVIKDSVVIRDSVVIIPQERYVDIVPQYDTLKLETSLASSISYVDTTNHTLRGSIENKVKSVSEKRVEIQIERVTDTVQIVEYKPYSVEKIVYKIPNWYKIVVTIFALLCILLGYNFRKLFKF